MMIKFICRSMLSTKFTTKARVWSKTKQSQQPSCRPADYNAFKIGREFSYRPNDCFACSHINIVDGGIITERRPKPTDNTKTVCQSAKYICICYGSVTLGLKSGLTLIFTRDLLLTASGSAYGLLALQISSSVLSWAVVSQKNGPVKQTKSSS